MLSIDRFENGYAICIDDEGNLYNIKRDKIKGNAQSGDIIEQKNDTDCYEVLRNETQKRRQEIQKLQDELFD